MNLSLTWGEAAAATGGKLLRGSPDAPLRALTTDSRSAGAGQAFVPRYALLASVHVALSTGWMSCAAVAVDRLARVFNTPAFARAIEALAAGSLLVLGVALAVGR